MASKSTTLLHNPIYQVRQDVIGEVVMVDHWLALMADTVGADWDRNEPVCMLEHILSCPLDQRAASVAASFIRWIGTNCGRAYLHEGREAMAKAGGDGYLYAWVRQNKRYRGARTIEHILSPASNFRHSGAILGSYLATKPTISDSDCEVIESIAIWLATDEGQNYLGGCETEIRGRITAQRQLERSQYVERVRSAQHA